MAAADVALLKGEGYMKSKRRISTSFANIPPGESRLLLTLDFIIRGEPEEIQSDSTVRPRVASKYPIDRRACA